MRQQHRRLIDQRLCGGGHRGIKRSDLQAGLRDDGVWQVVGCGQPVHRIELLFEQGYAVGQVLLAVCGHSQRQRVGQLECGKRFSGH